MKLKRLSSRFASPPKHLREKTKPKTVYLTRPVLVPASPEAFGIGTITNVTDADIATILWEALHENQ